MLQSHHSLLANVSTYCATVQITNESLPLSPPLINLLNLLRFRLADSLHADALQHANLETLPQCRYVATVGRVPPQPCRIS
jgi:hypothetical protein